MSTTATIEYPEPLYSLVDTSYEGLPMVLVVNSALCRFEHKEVFPWGLSVIIVAEDLAENGMPTRDESEVLTRVGDEIASVVLEGHNGLFAARSTWNGERQLLFRVHSAERANSALQQLIALGTQARAWEFQMEHDPAWSGVRYYLGLVGASPNA